MPSSLPDPISPDNSPDQLSAAELQPVTITGICGSFNATGATRRALALALDAAQLAGAEVQLLDLREFNLPFAESGFEPANFPDVARFNQLVRQSDGLIWATPEYHGSFSGALKNALDLGSFAEYEGKMVALLGVAAGQIGAIQALSHLRTVARQLHAWVLPSQLSIARAYAAFDADGQLSDPKLAAALTEMSAELVKWARLHAAGK